MSVTPAPFANHTMLQRNGWVLKSIKAVKWVSGGVIAAWSVLLVAWLILHWAILPHIEQWRRPIEQRASAALGVPVKIGNIIVRSSGWVPSLELGDVQLLDAQGRTALSLPRVLAALSPRSLLSLKLRFEQLLIDGAHLEVRRDTQGRVWVAGLDFNGARAEGGDSRRAADWFFQQHEFVIRGGSMRWTDEQLGSAPLELADMNLVVRNGLRRHDVRLDATPPAAWGERFSLRGVFTQSLLADPGDWRRWSGTAHAELPRADVSQLRQHVKLPFDLTQGDGALRAWVEVRDGEPAAATLDIALRTVVLRLRPDLEPLAFEQVEGRLLAQRSGDGGSVALQQFGFLTADGVRWPRSDMKFAWRQRADRPLGGEITAERLDLGLMAQVAGRLPLGDNARRLLAELDPVGVVNGLQLRWGGPLDGPDTYDVKASLSGMSLNAKASTEPQGVGRPGLRNADIQLSANEKGGQAQLRVVDGAVDLPGVFGEARLPFDQFSSQLNWRVEIDRTLDKAAKTTDALPKITLQVKDTKFANADAQGEMQATWTTGAGVGVAKGGRYPGRLELDAKLTRGVAARAARYLPLGIPEEVRLYVQQAVRSGSVGNLAIHVKGDLHEFPFYHSRNARDGEFRIAAHAEDVTLAYIPNFPARGSEPAFTSPWPEITNINGELVFDRATMEIRNAQGRLSGVALSNVQGGISNLAEHSVLAIQGTAKGPLADMLRFVNVTPVGGWSGKVLAQSTGSGNAELKLALNVPLADASMSTVKGSIALDGNDIRITPDTLAFGATRGKVDFTQKSFAVSVASARLLGGEVNFEGGSMPDGAVRFNGTGIATAEGLRRAGASGGLADLSGLSRLAGSLSGQAGYRVALGFVRGRSELSINSNLVGLAADLPAPLRKSAETPLALRYQNVLATDVPAGLLAGTPAQRDVLRFELGPIVQAQYWRDLSGDTPRVLRGGIGVMEPAPAPLAGVAANINLPSLNVDAWEKAGNKLLGGANPPNSAAAPDSASSPGTFTAYVPTVLGLRAQELVAGSRKLSRVVAGLSQDDGQWRANVSADQLNGYVEYRAPRRAAGNAPAGVLGDGGAGRVYARLSRLSLPKGDADDVEHLLDQPTTSVPSLDIVVDDFELRGKRLGRVEVEAINRPIANAAADGPAREWRLTRLAMTTPEARLTATGNWAAAGLTAGSGSAPGSPRSVMNFKLDLADSGALLERLGMGRTVRGGKGAMAGQVAWQGSPLSFDYATMSGQMSVAIDSGQLLKAEPGAARLLSVLSLQSLPRRLALDFRDVFQEGFAFDSINGNLKVNQGVAHTNNLRMRGVQAAVLLEGSADIESETQDMRVVVVPEINAGTASLAYAAINPAVGLGTFLAQMFLRKPLTQAGTREFHVTGPWGDPKVDRVERKFTDAVPDFEAMAPAPAPAAGDISKDAATEPNRVTR